MDSYFKAKDHTCIKVSTVGKKSIKIYMLSTPDKWTKEQNEIILNKNETEKLIGYLNIELKKLKNKID